MRPFFLMTALACTSLLCAAPEQAEAQVFWRPWLRPRVVLVPPRIITSVAAPPIFAAPQVVIQPQYPQPYYYPPPPPPVYVQPPLPPPPVYVQPAPPPPPVYVQPAPPPPVYVQPAPPPPVYVQPAPPPVYVQPPPPPVQAPPPPLPPVYVQPAPPPPPLYRPTVPPASQWAAKFGIGGRFAGTINVDQGSQGATFGQLGFGGEFLYRIHRRVVMELAGEYQKRVDSGFDRYDVPVTLGVRLHIGAPDWVVSPYFVAAAGGVYSNLDYLRSQDTAWFVDGQLGGGLEIRLGRHFALNADVRLDARHRLTKPDDATAATLSINGKPFSPLGDSYGGQFRIGAAVYF